MAWQATLDFLNFLNTAGDERTFGLPLMKPWQPIVISLFYVLLVKVIGPKFMENRKPYKLQYTLIVYNAVQVALSVHLFIESARIWGDPRTWFRCMPIADPSDPNAMHMIAKHHLYYMSKYIELLDTVFFILRKKYGQASFLHVYHHGSMPFFSCISLRFAPGSSITFIGFLNTFVHIIMYSYYMFAAMGPQFQKYLTWKKYLTSLQLIQFVTMFLHYLLVAFSGEECNIPKFLLVFSFSTIALNFFLFSLFFNQEYKQKNKGKKIETNGNLLESKELKSKNVSNEVRQRK